MPKFNAIGNEPMSYALFPDNKGLFYSHVTFMIMAFWILMPIGIMMGLAKSNFHIPIQILVFVVSLFGFLFGRLYGHATPRLYTGNIHHSMGWIIFTLLNFQLTAGAARKWIKAIQKPKIHQYETIGLMENSEPLESPPTPSRSQILTSKTILHANEDNHQDVFDSDSFNLTDEDPVHFSRFIKNTPVATIARNPIINAFCRTYHYYMSKIFVLLLFTQTISGYVVYHGVCQSWEIFGCITHLIKGGIFFFYGLVTFARYMGAFSGRGWAWNYVKGGSRFSCEMMECGLIFIYGIANTWMEHFGQDVAWSHKSLEHISLAFMYWWAGLLGIFVESRAVRRVVENALPELPYEPAPVTENEDTTNFNPIPVLTIFMTGISMGNHHQDSLYYSRAHYFCGLLISAAAVCRMMTYISMFRNPPKTKVPTRPPSELLVAFLLTCGAILFMASNQGTMLWLRRNGTDFMFLLNVTVSLTGMVLSYVAFLILLKSWATNRERAKAKQVLAK
ncbi:hypothetical protein K501DRAFT_189883 [Backusella circina FSU 941]|nr:hypothetical protein K501DRAFT_189883 [Backusella circina FSU 941]